MTTPTPRPIPTARRSEHAHLAGVTGSGRSAQLAQRRAEPSLPTTSADPATTADRATSDGVISGDARRPMTAQPASPKSAEECSAAEHPAPRPPVAVGPLGGRRALSVWETGQRPAAAQRGDRYTPATVSHPARMLPAVAAYAIEALTRPGELVLDPMCGAGTTLIEALHLGRAAVGIDVEPRWASIARDNIDHARRAGVGGYAHVLTADARGLPEVLPAQYAEQLRGRVSLVLTSPPYGPATHGQVDTGADGVRKSDFRYSQRATGRNLAYQPLHRLLAGFSRILAGCLPLLAPGGMVAVTTRPWREHGELIDLPDMVTLAAAHAGLLPVQHCVALLGRLDPDRLIDRASFFQRASVAKARRAGQPWHLITHEDVVLVRKPAGCRTVRHRCPTPSSTTRLPIGFTTTGAREERSPLPQTRRTSMAA